MKHLRISFSLAVLLALLLTSIGYAQDKPVEPMAVGSITLPVSVTAGETFFFNFEITSAGYNCGGGTCIEIRFREAWYTQDSDYALTSDYSGLSWSLFSSISSGTVGGFPARVLVFKSNALLTLGAEDNFSAAIKVSASAPIGTNQPVAVREQISALGYSTKTGYVNVVASPAVRYIADSTCGTSTPCDIGPGALSSAVSALPASGGTIYVVGTHKTDGVGFTGKEVTLRGLTSAAVLSANTQQNSSLVAVGLNAALTVQDLTLDCVNTAANLVGVSQTNGANLFLNNVAVRSCTTGVSGGGPGVIENSRFLNNNLGILTGMGANLTVRGSQFTNNTGYALSAPSGTVTAYANNFSGNNGGGYQVKVSAVAAAAKNWWGSYTNASVGPERNSGGSFTEAWGVRLGSSVKAWAAGASSTSLGGATLSGGSGIAVIIDLGSGTANAPFGVAVTPYANLMCSSFYDYYVMGSGSWTVGLPILNTTSCTDNVLVPQRAYFIQPGTYDTQCTAAGSTACWDPVENTILADVGNRRLLVTMSASDLSSTHFVAGDSSMGVDPTLIRLQSMATRSPYSAWLPVVMLSLALIGAGGFTYLLRRQKR